MRKIVQMNFSIIQNRNRITDVDNKLQLPRGKEGRDKLGDWD